MEKNFVTKLLGFGAVALTLAATVLNAWSEDKKIEELVEAKVNEKLSAKDSEEES